MDTDSILPTYLPTYLSRMNEPYSTRISTTIQYLQNTDVHKIIHKLDQANHTIRLPSHP